MVTAVEDVFVGTFAEGLDYGVIAFSKQLHLFLDVCGSNPGPALPAFLYVLEKAEHLFFLVLVLARDAFELSRALVQVAYVALVV